MEKYNIEPIAAIIFICYLIYRDYRNELIIKDLMNRLMSKDFVQYSNITKKKNANLPVHPSKSDKEMEEWEKVQMSQVNDINKEIDEQLELVSALRKHDKPAGSLGE